MSDQPSVVEGTIDSIRDGVAVVLVGDQETELTLPATQLPDGAKEGSRLEVALDGDKVVGVTVTETEPSIDELRDRMNKLKAKRTSRLLGHGDGEPLSE